MSFRWQCNIACEIRGRGGGGGKQASDIYTTIDRNILKFVKYLKDLAVGYSYVLAVEKVWKMQTCSFYREGKQALTEI